MKIVFISCCLMAAMYTSIVAQTGSMLSAADAEAIVREHNVSRSEVGVPQLKWSNSLAKESQAWAEALVGMNCAFEHSDTENGENIYYRYGEGPVTEAVKSWADEKSLYKGGKYTMNSSAYGHYTQIVWRDTQEVGCGMASCPNGRQIWVCQYYPAGNWVGEFPY